MEETRNSIRERLSGRGRRTHRKPDGGCGGHGLGAPRQGGWPSPPTARSGTPGLAGLCTFRSCFAVCAVMNLPASAAQLQPVTPDRNYGNFITDAWLHNAMHNAMHNTMACTTCHWRRGVLHILSSEHCVGTLISVMIKVWMGATGWRHFM